MPDVNSQAAPEGQVIQPAGQVPEQVQNTNAQAEQQTEEAITRDLIARIAREEATRIAQSQVAKGENRINQRIQEQLAALQLNKGALGLSDEQVTQARQKIVMDAFTAVEEPPTSGTPQGQAPDVDQAIQYLNAQIESVFADVGAQVTQADPESKELQRAIDAAWNDPNGLWKIMNAANKAATLKKERLASRQNNAQARVVSGGANSTYDPNDISGITDPRELYRLGEQKIGGKKP